MAEKKSEFERRREAFEKSFEADNCYEAIKLGDALRQARMVRDIMLLRNTTNLDKLEIEKLLKDPEAEPQTEAEKNRKKRLKLPSWFFWFRKK